MTETRNAATGGPRLALADAAARGCAVSAYWLDADIGDYETGKHSDAFGGRTDARKAMDSWLRLAAYRAGYPLDPGAVDAALASAHGPQPTGPAKTEAAQRVILTLAGVPADVRRDEVDRLRREGAWS